MSELHGYIAEGLIGVNLLAGVWGAAVWFMRRPSVAFWYILRAAQIFVVLQVVLGAILLMTGREPREGIHLLYGLLPLLVMLVAESMRVGVAARELGEDNVRQLPESEQQAVALRIIRRETGIMAVACLLVFALAIRAAMTAGYFS